MESGPDMVTLHLVNPTLSLPSWDLSLDHPVTVKPDKMRLKFSPRAPLVRDEEDIPFVKIKHTCSAHLAGVESPTSKEVWYAGRAPEFSTAPVQIESDFGQHRGLQEDCTRITGDHTSNRPDVC
uniref:Uncharacterized protein n=1 Tax=Timema douglasi TaxID=61478 RepID=A0A7R8VX46_TIMDO|nr:unnamed protein product [Timema douglasi]